MPITTDDCKALLASDPILLATGATDSTKWKRLSKKNAGPLVERVFAHPCGTFAKVVEDLGSIRIASCGPSLSSLDDPSLLRAPPAASAAASEPPTETTLSTPLWTRLATPKAAASARALAIRQLDVDVDEDEDGEGFRQSVKKLDPVAWANQFVFAISSEPGLAAISPLLHFERKGFCYDQESPIEHLLPNESYDLNGCGSWEFSFDGSPQDLAMDLMARGFQWNPEFQKLMDEDAMPIMAPILEQRELEKTTPSSTHALSPGPRL